MLAEQLDSVIGVDPHRDVHALAVVEVRTGGIVLEAAIAANTAGYRRALELATTHAGGRRAFAVEGSGSFGAGLTRFLTAEVSRSSRSDDCGGNAARAARPTRSTRSVVHGWCSRRSGGQATHRRPARSV